jgi:pyrimidine-nucleoside phosphorylase
MNQPLGMTAGNWLEVVEAVQCLRGKNIPDLMEVTYVLGGAMVWLGGKAVSIEQGMNVCHSALWSGKAYEKFLQVVKSQGGDFTFIDQPQKYPASAHIVEVKSQSGGYVDGFETTRIGLLASRLGAGRRKVDDVIDPKAGIVFRKKLGDKVEKNETLAVIHTDREQMVDSAVRELAACISVGSSFVERRPCIRAYVDAEGVKPWAPVRLV